MGTYLARACEREEVVVATAHRGVYYTHGEIRAGGAQTHTVDGADVLFFSGGSGVAPVFAVIRAILHDRAVRPRRLRLVTSDTSHETMLLGDQLSELAAAHSLLEWTCHITRGAPRPCAVRGAKETIAGRVDFGCTETTPDTLTLVCGPQGLVRSCRDGVASATVIHW